VGVRHIPYISVADVTPGRHLAILRQEIEVGDVGA
jgi:hypothetical protein